MADQDPTSQPNTDYVDQAELDALMKQMDSNAGAPAAAAPAPEAAAVAADAGSAEPSAAPAAEVATAIAAEAKAEPAAPAAVALAAEPAAGPVAVAEPAVLGARGAVIGTEAATRLDIPDFATARGAPVLAPIDLLDDVELDVKIELGRTQMYIEDVLRLSVGSVVELDKLAGDPVDIFVNERLVARGEVLVLNENFCVRINDIVNSVGEAHVEK